MKQNLKVILVAGAWCGGTSALAGAVAKLGVTTLQPLQQLDDERTQISYELEPFRDAVVPFFDESKIARRPGRSNLELLASLQEFRQRAERGNFGPWPGSGPRRLILKTPIASLCIPQISAVLETDVLFIKRDLDEIEASRARRNWPHYLGRAGAEVLYATAAADLSRAKRPHLAMNYRDLQENPMQVLEEVIDFCKLPDLAGNLVRAAKFVRPRNPIYRAPSINDYKRRHRPSYEVPDAHFFNTLSQVPYLVQN